MYFYVLETPTTSASRKLDEQLLTLLRGSGVAGEVALANPARPAAELAKVGLTKGYETIVAIGGDRIINGVAQVLQSTRAVMGIVPINAHPRIRQLLGVTTPEAACELLRHRRVQRTDISFIDPGRYFLTEARIAVHGELPVRVHVDDVVIETEITRLSLFGDGSIELVNERLGRSILRTIIDQILGRPKLPANVTQMKGSYLKIEANRAIPVRVGNETIGHTPFVAAVKPVALNLIVARPTPHPWSD